MVVFFGFANPETERILHKWDFTVIDYGNEEDEEEEEEERKKERKREERREVPLEPTNFLFDFAALAKSLSANNRVQRRKRSMVLLLRINQFLLMFF